MNINAALKNGSAIPDGAVRNPIEVLLEQMLAEAKAGRLSSVAVLAVPTTGGVAPFWAGMQAGDLFIGASILQKRLLDAMEQPQKPTILRARPAG